MMITEPYVALAFFAPVTVKTFENVTIVEDALEKYLSSIAAGCHDEFIRFKASAHRPSAGAVTLDSYRSYISNRIRPQYPTIATVLINLLAACPTEAAVERGFSFLKFIANDWRNRLEEETVEALLVLPSCHKMLKGISRDAGTPVKASRSESKPLASQVRSTPQRHEQPSQSPDPDVVQSYDPFSDPFAPAEPEEVEDDDESDVEEIDTPTVSCAILKHVLAAYVAKVSNRATIAPVTASMKVTRRKADTCICNDDLSAVSCLMPLSFVVVRLVVGKVPS
jgi:hypothetical protein